MYVIGIYFISKDAELFYLPAKPQFGNEKITKKILLKKKYRRINISSDKIDCIINVKSFL